MAENEEIANIISSLVSDKEDEQVSAEEVGDSIAVSISKTLSNLFNRMKGPEQVTPVVNVNTENVIQEDTAGDKGESFASSISESLGNFYNKLKGKESLSPVTNLNTETVASDDSESGLITYLNTAFLPVLTSINDAVQPQTKEEREEGRRSLTESISDAFRNAIFGSDDSDDESTKPKKSGGFLSKIMDGLGSLGELGGNFIKGVIGLTGLAVGLVGFAFGLKKLMEVVGINFGTLILATATIGGFFLLIRQIGKDFSQIAKGVLAFGLAVATLYGFSKALEVFGDVNFVKVTLGAAAVFGFFKIISTIGGMFAQVAKGALAFGLIGGTLLLFSKALETFSKVNFKAVIFGGIALVAFATAAGLMGSFVVPIALGAAAIAALGVALIPFAYAMKVFGSAAQKFIPVLEAFGGVLGDFVKVIGGTYVKIIEGITAAYGKLAESLGSVVEKLGDTTKKVLDTISDFSNNVSAANILAASAAIGTLAASLAAFAAADFGSALLSAGSSVLDFFTGRIGNIELIGILASMSEQTEGLDMLADSVSNLAKEMVKFSFIKYDSSFVDYLEDLNDALNGEINLTAGLFEKGLAFFGGTEISLFSGLMTFVNSAEPMKMFADSIDLVADAINRLSVVFAASGSEIVTNMQKFGSITFDKSYVNYLDDLNTALNGEINVNPGLFEVGLSILGGREISMFSGLMKLAASSEPMQMFAQATDLAADAITRLAAALVAFDADTFDRFVRTTASEDFTQLQEDLNNSGLVASAVFATRLEEAVSAEVTRQIAAEAGSAEAGGPVIVQNSAAPQVNTFSINSSLQPTSTDLELMKIIGHGNILQ